MQFLAVGLEITPYNSLVFASSNSSLTCLVGQSYQPNIRVPYGRISASSYVR
jgi:hypothetical protein